jgi:chromosomal replication initiation ATPase DnaA
MRENKIFAGSKDEIILKLTQKLDSLGYVSKIFLCEKNGTLQERIIPAVCEVMGLSQAKLYNRSRAQQYTFLRHACRYFLRKYTLLSLKEISRMTGCDNHTTVIHSARAWQNLIDTDERYAELHQRIKTRLGVK